MHRCGFVLPIKLSKIKKNINSNTNIHELLVERLWAQSEKCKTMSIQIKFWKCPTRVWLIPRVRQTKVKVVPIDSNRHCQEVGSSSGNFTLFTLSLNFTLWVTVTLSYQSFRILLFWKSYVWEAAHKLLHNHLWPITVTVWLEIRILEGQQSVFLSLEMLNKRCQKYEL